MCDQLFSEATFQEAELPNQRLRSTEIAVEWEVAYGMTYSDGRGSDLGPFPIS